KPWAHRGQCLRWVARLPKGRSGFPCFLRTRTRLWRVRGFFCTHLPGRVGLEEADPAAPGTAASSNRQKQRQMVRKWREQLLEFLKREGGPTAVEYAVMLALIVVVCITAITALGTNANKTFSNVALNTAVGS